MEVDKEVLEIRRLSYKERLEILADKYGEIRRAYLSNADYPVEEEMTKFQKAFVEIALGMHRDGLSMEQVLS